MKMLGRKLLGVLLAAILLLETMGLAMAAAPSIMADKLAEVERTAYGVPQTGALLDRVNKLEKDFEGTHEPTESVMQRVDKLFDMMFKNENGPSLVTRMNAIEWGIKQSVSMEPIQKRVSDMEIAMTGAPSEGTYKARISTLASYAFGDKEIPLAQIQVPANTLVKVSLVTPVNAKNLKVGDRIEIKSEEDVIENGRLIFAKGAPGYGEVTKVKRAGNFGRVHAARRGIKRKNAVHGLRGGREHRGHRAPRTHRHHRRGFREGEEHRPSRGDGALYPNRRAHEYLWAGGAGAGRRSEIKKLAVVVATAFPYAENRGIKNIFAACGFAGGFFCCASGLDVVV